MPEDAEYANNLGTNRARRPANGQNNQTPYENYDRNAKTTLNDIVENQNNEDQDPVYEQDRGYDKTYNHIYDGLG